MALRERALDRLLWEREECERGRWISDHTSGLWGIPTTAPTPSMIPSAPVIIRHNTTQQLSYMLYHTHDMHIQAQIHAYTCKCMCLYMHACVCVCVCVCVYCAWVMAHQRQFSS